MACPSVSVGALVLCWTLCSTLRCNAGRLHSNGCVVGRATEKLWRGIPPIILSEERDQHKRLTHSLNPQEATLQKRNAAKLKLVVKVHLQRTENRAAIEPESSQQY
jgi:hypothetical protein